MPNNHPYWICCQIGAREHYAIPRALHQQQQLACLITDAWIPPQSVVSRFPAGLFQKLSERFQLDLDDAPIVSFEKSLIGFEINQRFQRNCQWDKIIARNNWFQNRAIQALTKLLPTLNSQTVLFCYSYAARELLNFAKAQGWKTVLGQIDPGYHEEQIVLGEVTNQSHYRANWQPAPDKYWSSWQEECSLADRILVNSSWSKQALEKVGISSAKMEIVPLAYQAAESARQYIRTYPEAFSKSRPLRVLFLGQVILRKGIVALLEAAKMLQDEPIEFWIVGSVGFTIPKSIQALDRIFWVGSIPRSEASLYYQKADVFLFPTLSDGFGLTQLEAQAWKLPVIASPYCGEVVMDKINGLVLTEVTGEEIARLIRICLRQPSTLQDFASRAVSSSDFSMSKLYQSLEML
jgi:glycosyltransferase involved in cell wall biosynthesis